MPKTTLYRYACLDFAGRDKGKLEIQITRRDESLEIISTDSAGLKGYARLGAGMIQEEVTLDTASGGTLRFNPSSIGDARLGDRSLFLIVPTLVDPRTVGVETRFVLVRPEGGQRVVMRLRSEGVVDVADFYGNMERAYRIRMDLADPIARFVWPYTYNYYYRIPDQSFFAYDGPDENRKNSRIILIDSQHK